MTTHCRFEGKLHDNADMTVRADWLTVPQEPSQVTILSSDIQSINLATAKKKKRKRKRIKPLCHYTLCRSSKM